MGWVAIRACLPWLAWLGVSCLALALLCRASRAKLDLSRVSRLHGNEVGSVQGLSFVLVLPFFVTIVLFIVQVSQLMIGTIVVQYAAFAGAVRRQFGFPQTCRTKAPAASAATPWTRTPKINRLRPIIHHR